MTVPLKARSEPHALLAVWVTHSSRSRTEEDWFFDGEAVFPAGLADRGARRAKRIHHLRARRRGRVEITGQPFNLITAGIRSRGTEEQAPRQHPPNPFPLSECSSVLAHRL